MSLLLMRSQFLLVSHLLSQRLILGLVVSQVLRDLLSRAPTHLQQTHLPAHLLSFRLYLLLLRGSTNKRWSEGRGLIAASPHLHALIHRSAWNARSRKFRIAPILCGRVLM